MRSIGLVMFLLIASWVGLGFSLYANIDAYQTQTQIQQQIDQLQKDKAILQEQLAQVSSDLSAIQSQNNQLAEENKLLQNQVVELQNEKKDLQSQYSDVQSQLDGLKELDTLVGKIARIPYQSLLLALFVPALPVSFAVTYVVYHYSHRHSSGRKASQRSNSNRKISIMVTETEMQQIVKMRRGQL